jgi:zinc protease
MTIAGDFDIKQTKTWVEKYFGDIKRGETIPKWKTVCNINRNKNCITGIILPKLPTHTAWPSVYEYHLTVMR